MLLLILTAGANCELPDLQATMDDVERAFVEMSDEFEGLRGTFRERIDCLDQPLERKAAADIHKTRALFGFYDEDSKLTEGSFARFRSLQPKADLSAELAPADHPLRKAFEDAVVEPKPTPLPAPATGWLMVDGSQEEEAPRNLPFMLQQVADDGSVVFSFLVDVGADLPAYERAPFQPEPERRGGGGMKLAPLTIAGVGILGAGLVTYGAAFGTRGAYKRSVIDEDVPRIRRNHALTNGLTVGGLGLMGAGAGLVIGGVI